MTQPNWQLHGIDISKVRGGKSFCPRCHATRKNKRDRSLSVDLQSGLYKCHNDGCGYSGSAAVNEHKKQYTKPLPRLQKVGDDVLDWFQQRGISNNTLLTFKVTESSEWMPECQNGQRIKVVCFNYYRNDELVNVKYRSRGKGFRLEKGAELILYNLDTLEGRKEAVITEGEIDALSVYEAGIPHVVSVPNGASMGKNARLEYIDNCWQAFEGIEKIIIATDDDEAGRALAEELIRRLGSERCYTIRYPEGCKDANEVLVKHGKNTLKQIIADAEPLPIEGISTVLDNLTGVMDLYLNGYPRAAETGYHALNRYIRWMPAQLTIVTGVPGSGKSTWLSNVLVQLAQLHGWKVGMFTPEKTPLNYIIAELCQIVAGKAFYRKDGEGVMNRDELRDALNFIDQHFYFIQTDEVRCTVDGILGKAAELVKRHGINAFVTDPWNYVEHDRPAYMSETEYISHSLTKYKVSSKKYGLHHFIVAHPTKIKKQGEGKDKGEYEVPTLYDISGSAHWFNKADNGICIYRHYGQDKNMVYIQKVRWSFCGQVGSTDIWFSRHSQRFTETPPIAEPLPPPTPDQHYKTMNDAFWRKG